MLPWALKISAACLAASLILILLSFPASRRDLRRKIKAIDSDLQPGEARTIEESRLEIGTTVLNYSALVCLMLGIFFLIAHVSI